MTLRHLNNVKDNRHYNIVDVALKDYPAVPLVHFPLQLGDSISSEYSVRHKSVPTKYVTVTPQSLPINAHVHNIHYTRIFCANLLEVTSLHVHVSFLNRVDTEDRCSCEDAHVS